MTGIVLDRNLESDSMEYNCMNTDVVELVLFFFHETMCLVKSVVLSLSEI